MMHLGSMKAARRLAENVSALLVAQRHKQTDLAQWCRRSDVWVSQFLRGERNWQLDDLDRVADFFHIATYQLFQPGIASTTERRAGIDRRSGKERRIGQTQRMMLQTAAEIDSHRPPRKGTPHVAVVAASPKMAQLAKLTDDFERRVTALLSQADAGGQTAPARPPLAGPRARRRAARGPDAENPEHG